jgi:hypothetical protein
MFSMALPAHSGPRPLFQFRNHFSQAVGLLGRVINPSQGRYLNPGQHKNRINAYRHPYLEWDSNLRSQRPREKTIHALYSAATVTGDDKYTSERNKRKCYSEIDLAVSIPLKNTVKGKTLLRHLQGCSAICLQEEI